ncbi:hypothetical protein PR048_024069 [Dryococelus australis]|uniref:Uncharacterized protein n=1 Tax=Dryococelus australis TaxID=614101 RepID=A0ABQ9GVV1_9NEOP|nr:hypothetical protein PR048_024069 [Dryococelus australis]
MLAQVQGEAFKRGPVVHVCNGVRLKSVNILRTDHSRCEETQQLGCGAGTPRAGCEVRQVEARHGNQPAAGHCSAARTAGRAGVAGTFSPRWSECEVDNPGPGPAQLPRLDSAIPGSHDLLGRSTVLERGSSPQFFFPPLETEKRGRDKCGTATDIKCAIASKRKALNWRAVFSVALRVYAVHGRGKLELLEKTRRIAASPRTIRTCDKTRSDPASVGGASGLLLRHRGPKPARRLVSAGQMQPAHMNTSHVSGDTPPGYNTRGLRVVYVFPFRQDQSLHQRNVTGHCSNLKMDHSSHTKGEPGSTLGLSHVGIVPDDAAGFLGDLPFPPPFAFIMELLRTRLPSALKTSMLRAAQISTHYTLKASQTKHNLNPYRTGRQSQIPDYTQSIVNPLMAVADVQGRVGNHKYQTTRSP